MPLIYPLSILVRLLSRSMPALTMFGTLPVMSTGMNVTRTVATCIFFFIRHTGHDLIAMADRIAKLRRI